MLMNVKVLRTGNLKYLRYYVNGMYLWYCITFEMNKISNVET